MPVKVYFNEEIHRFAKLPVDLKALTQLITSSFRSELPPAWIVQYTDQDGDLIMITHDYDYRELLESESQDSSLTFKLYITAHGSKISTNSQNNREKPAQADPKPMYVGQAQQTNEVKPQAFPQPQYEGQSILSNNKKEEELSRSAQNIPEETKEEQVAFIDGKPVHTFILCRGCGVNPIVGVRYKCDTCHHFNFCEKCEETKEHPHPFLKLRMPRLGKNKFMKGDHFRRGPFEGPTEEQMKMFKAMKTFKKMTWAYKQGRTEDVKKYHEKLVLKAPELKSQIDLLSQASEQGCDHRQIKQMCKDLKQSLIELYDPEGKMIHMMHKKHGKHHKRHHKNHHKSKRDCFGGPFLNELTEQQIRLFENMAMFKQMVQAYKRGDTQKMQEDRAYLERELPELKPMLDKVFQVIAEGGDHKKVKEAMKEFKGQFIIQYFPEDKNKLFKQWKHWKRVQKEKRREQECLETPPELTELQLRILSNKGTFKEMIHAYKSNDTQKMAQCRAKLEQEIPELKPMLDRVFQVIAEGGDYKKVKETMKGMKQEVMTQFFPQGGFMFFKQYRQWKNSQEGNKQDAGWFWSLFKRGGPNK